MPAFFMRYIEVIIENINADTKDLLVAMLPEFGFHAMEEMETAIKAYAIEGEEKMDLFNPFLNDLGLIYEQNILEDKNWNASWESNFDPVSLPGKVLVRADFHPSQPGFEHEIVITPKMSFGTGHHATTRMMLQAMLEIDFNGKKVLDFGTGTGILAILAEKLGAEEIMAIDNDRWSFENTLENLAANKMSRIQVECRDDLYQIGLFDVILANINKNILSEYVSNLRDALKPGGTIIISGLLSNDYTDIYSLFHPYFGTNCSVYKQSGWLAITFF
ncbi:MAG: 50S ribosomal protein L11 methyltransferase [Chitinophagia bacterium]|nr:50S ribosomal protein L11 methyltransferase [Chitinophagia bacterium]